MKFTESQLKAYGTNGYAILDCPYLAPLTETCLAAVDKVALPPEERVQYGNKKLKPQQPGSYWTELCHTLPFLKIILHPELVELTKQVLNDDNIYLRNGGINDYGPNRPPVDWHRDSPREGMELMHYFTGATKENGCLRVIPGSHKWSDEESNARREEVTKATEKVREGFDELIPAPEMPGEVTVELEKNQLLFRHEKIWHATWVNKTADNRIMSHWRFRESWHEHHRFRFEEYLTPELIECLTPEQKERLWLGREFEIHPRYLPERERELGKVRWGLV